MAAENTCDCGAWKGEDFELCRDCAEMAREERNELVEVAYVARVQETEKAMLFKLTAGFLGKSLWVPKSILTDEDEGRGVFCVPRWWGDQEGVDYKDA